MSEFLKAIQARTDRKGLLTPVAPQLQAWDLVKDMEVMPSEGDRPAITIADALSFGINEFRKSAANKVRSSSGKPSMVGNLIEEAVAPATAPQRQAYDLVKDIKVAGGKGGQPPITVGDTLSFGLGQLREGIADFISPDSKDSSASKKPTEPTPAPEAAPEVAPSEVPIKPTPNYPPSEAAKAEEEDSQMMEKAMERLPASSDLQSPSSSATAGAQKSPMERQATANPEVPKAKVIVDQSEVDKLFKVTHGSSFDPKSKLDMKKRQEIESLLAEKGGLGDMTPNQFALQVYRKFNYV